MPQIAEKQSSLIAQEYRKLFTIFFTAIDEGITPSLNETLLIYPQMSQELFYLFCGLLCINTRSAVNQHPESSTSLFGAITTFSEQIPHPLHHIKQPFTLRQIQCVTNTYSTTEHNKLAQLFLNRSIGDDYHQQYPSARELENALNQTIKMTEIKLNTLLHTPQRST
jgi:hypothetical protein